MITRIKSELNFLYNHLKYAKTTPFQKRHDDIYLVSFPKSGNTWLGFIIANIINEHLQLKLSINFNNIRIFIPDIHVDRNINPSLEFFPFRRIIKSHSKYNPFYNCINFLVRNPFDVMASYYNYTTKLGQFTGTTDEFVTNKFFGIDAWVDHTESWLDKTVNRYNMQVVKYEDLKSRPGDEVEGILRWWGFSVDKQIISLAIEKSNFKNMKKIEEETAIMFSQRENQFQFVRKGKVGGANEVLSDRAIDIIYKRSTHLIDLLAYKDIEPLVIKNQK